MASINYGAREISVKIVYYGPGLSGKTTNLQVIHRKIPPEHKSDMVSLATETDRTLFFDFLPLDLGTIKGFSTKFQLYTVPGQVYYNATRKLVLRGVDGVVFVADSGADKIPENLESFQNLEDNLAEYHYKREEIPIIIQYNKRDLPNAMTIEELQQHINKYNLPWTEAVANKGIGVFDALKLMGKIVIDNLNRKYSRLSRGVAGTPAAPRPQQAAPAGYQYPPQPQVPMAPRQQYAPAPQPQYAPPPQAPAEMQPQMRPMQQPSYSGMGPVPMPPAGPSAAPPAYQPFPQQAPSYAAPQEQRFAPLPAMPEPSRAPAAPEEGQQKYGFVNFEPLPIQPQAGPAMRTPAYQPQQDPRPVSPEAAQQQPAEPAAVPEPPRGTGHAVVFPQKQRPAPRTQINERDYSVYNTSQQSFPKTSASGDLSSAEDTDFRMQKKLNIPPGKQQKGFLSKFFNRDE